ncbi:hypothetical protein Tco_0907179 [Tanacetum coccineum]|uniref:Uncharacterized protein n=1 Tax=Tanacetum coccineum TaxID=301880 RepID=A0ABQ5CPR3_9ASTR
MAYAARREESIAEEQDEQQQQNMLDVELIPINEQVKIAVSNFWIALEKTQPDVIYKFGYTVAYDVTTKAHFFKIDDQVFESTWSYCCSNCVTAAQVEVNADKLKLLVYKLLLLVFRVNAASTKLQLLKRLQLLQDKDCLEIM